jgi:hypothetical protein
LVVGQKSGVAYALDPNRQGQILWQSRVGKGGTVVRMPVESSIIAAPAAKSGSIAKTAFETRAMFYGFHQVPCLRAFRNIMSS